MNALAARATRSASTTTAAARRRRCTGLGRTALRVSGNAGEPVADVDQRAVRLEELGLLEPPLRAVPRRAVRVLSGARRRVGRRRGGDAGVPHDERRPPE